MRSCCVRLARVARLTNHWCHVVCVHPWKCNAWAQTQHFHAWAQTQLCVCARAPVRVCQQVSKKKAQTHLGRAQGGSPQDEEDFGIFEFDSEHARGVFLSEWAASKEKGAKLMAAR